jgi:membrane protease YdiL (CAAX protease family)
VPRRIAFVAVTHAWSWGWWWTLVLTGHRVTPGHGWPSHFPGLLGPFVGAVVVTAAADGRDGQRRLGRRLTRVDLGAAGWGLALGTPLVLLAAGALASGGVAWSELDDMNGLPAVGVLGVWALLVFVNGIGEETGWRGFLLPLERRDHDLVPAAARVTAVWALWHLPLFWLVPSYGDGGPVMFLGLVVGLGAGSLVLSWVTERTGGSILAAAVWHGTYNLAVATGDDPVRSAVATALVIAWAVGIAHHAGTTDATRPGARGPRAATTSVTG